MVIDGNATMNLLLTIALASIASSAAFTAAPSVSSSTNRAAVISLNEAKNGFGGGDDNHNVIQTRRDTLQSIIIGGTAVVVAGSAPNIAMAFPNKISNKYDDRPRQRGSKVRFYCGRHCKIESIICTTLQSHDYIAYKTAKRIRCSNTS